MLRTTVLSLVLTVALTTGALASDVGLIISTRGDVKVYHPKKDKWSKASVMLGVADGGKVQVGPQSEAVVTLFQSGGRFLLPGGSIAVLSPGGCRTLSGPPARPLAALQVRHAQLLQGSRVASGRSAGIVVRSGFDAIELHSLSTTATLDTRPVFKWRAVEGAPSYKIRLWNENDEQIWQSEVTTPGVTYPADAPELKPNVEYLWMVTTAVNDTRFKAEGVFRILPADQREAVTKELSALQATEHGMDDDATTGVLRAEIYSRSGLWDDAINCYEKLARSFPDAAVIHATLANLLAEQGRAEQSRQHQKTAEQLAK